MTIYIHPQTNCLYSSFYFNGLEKFFGRSAVRFTTKPFVDLPKSVWGKNLPVIVEDEGVQTRYFIDTDDSFKVNPEAYAWCDHYASVNANFEKTEEQYREKLISLCPSFGIKCWNFFSMAPRALSSILSSNSAGVRKVLGKYKRMCQRETLEEYYKPVEVKDGYVFFCATLWYSDEWNKNDENVNLTRANFIRACKNLSSIEFEGGLVPQGEGRSSESKFADCLATGVPMKEWMLKTKESAVVFNTPAFWNCHGWKLGEYLAMGKAIISTPLSNDLPEPLVHGVNIHFVENNQEAIQEAVQLIVSSPDYRRRLEAGAKEYWAKFGTPEASLRLMGIERK